MDDIIMVVDYIEDIEYNGKVTGKRCTGKDGNQVNVKGGKKGSKLYERWDELQVGTAYKFIMADYTNPKKEVFPYVADFVTIEGELSPAVKPDMRPEDKKIVAQAVREGTPPPNPQAVGMMTKNIADMIIASVQKHGNIAGVLKTIFWNDAAIELVRWYRNQALGTTQIPFDGTDLPELKSKEH